MEKKMIKSSIAVSITEKFSLFPFSNFISSSFLCEEGKKLENAFKNSRLVQLVALTLLLFPHNLLQIVNRSV